MTGRLADSADRLSNPVRLRDFVALAFIAGTAMSIVTDLLFSSFYTRYESPDGIGLFGFSLTKLLIVAGFTSLLYLTLWYHLHRRAQPRTGALVLVIHITPVFYGLSLGVLSFLGAPGQVEIRDVIGIGFGGIALGFPLSIGTIILFDIARAILRWFRLGTDGRSESRGSAPH